MGRLASAGPPVALAVLAIAWQWGRRCVMIVAVSAEIPPRALSEAVGRERNAVMGDDRKANREDDGVRINRLKLAYGWRSDMADLPQSAIGAATSEVEKGIATDLKWARGEIKKNNVWWS